MKIKRFLGILLALLLAAGLAVTAFATEAQLDVPLVVLVNGNEATIKKVYIDDGGITLHAFNPYYPDIHYTPEEVETLPVRFFGRVVETRSKY